MINKLEKIPREDAEILILEVNDAEDLNKSIWDLIELAYNLGRGEAEQKYSAMWR